MQESNYYKFASKYLNILFVLCPIVYLVGIRYTLDLEAPILIFFKKASNETLRYLGPENVQDLLSFVKEQMYGENTLVKV